MGIIETDKWLEEHFNRPAEICRLINPQLKNPGDFYRYLTKFGMYRPSRAAMRAVHQLREEDIWRKIEKFYNKYQKKWNGPKVDIYIFPINESNRFLMRYNQKKSGIAFKNHIFFFLSPGLEDKMIEALVIHEYHHASRMHFYSKDMHEYTLLDSLIFEGLAEIAVLNYCGKQYTANWTKAYPLKQLKDLWKSAYESNLNIDRNDRLHDQLLFGENGMPKMLGYAMGYELANGYIKKNKLSMYQSLKLSSESFLTRNSFIDD